MQQQAFIFIGRSGSGKGTQSARLMDYLKKKDPSRGVLYIQTGQELRQFIQGDSKTQQITREHYDKGELMPEFIATYAWIRLVVEKYTGSEHLLFDGTPRKVHEATVLHSAFVFYGIAKITVIHIDISKDEALKRLLLRKRIDDSEEDIIKRLSWYEEEVAPTVDYFRNNPKYNFFEIAGEKSAEDIHNDIVEKLGLR